MPDFFEYAESFTRTVVEFARYLPSGVALAGIHLDVEPHLLLQFASPVLRIGLYRRMIYLHGRLAEVVHTGSTLEYGADVTFWMKDSVDVNKRYATVVINNLQHIDHMGVLA